VVVSAVAVLAREYVVVDRACEEPLGCGGESLGSGGGGCAVEAPGGAMVLAAAAAVAAAAGWKLASWR
jgi:hypothetical protein